MRIGYEINDICINHRSLIINEIFYLLKVFDLRYLSYLCMPFYFNYNVVFISRQETKLLKKWIFGTMKYLRTPKSCFSYNFFFYIILCLEFFCSASWGNLLYKNPWFVFVLICSRFNTISTVLITTYDDSKNKSSLYP